MCACSFYIEDIIAVYTKVTVRNDVYFDMTWLPPVLFASLC